MKFSNSLINMAQGSYQNKSFEYGKKEYDFFEV